MKTTMFDYIKETPELMREKIKNASQWTGAIAQGWRQMPYSCLTIVASGSSYHAAQCAKLFLEDCLNSPVYILTPFYFEYYHKIREDSMHVFISQSGYSTNTLSAMEKLKKQNISHHLITNNREIKSNAYMEVHNLDIGEEYVPFVTKGFTLTLLFLTLFGVCLIPTEQAKRYHDALGSIPGLFEKQQSAARTFFEQQKLVLVKTKRIHICGYGANLYTVYEAALKFCETLQVAASAYETEEFLHSGYLETEENHLVLLLDQEKEGQNRVRQLQQNLPSLVKAVYTVKGAETIPAVLSPLANIAFFQTLVYLINEHKGNTIPSMKEKYIEFEIKLRTKTVNYYKY